MRKVNIVIRHPVGLHARPAALFSQMAMKFRSRIRISKPSSDFDYDAKSIVGVLALGVSSGDEIIIAVDGSDEEKALDALKELIESNFGEE